jgi:hypothetical protein
MAKHTQKSRASELHNQRGNRGFGKEARSSDRKSIPFGKSRDWDGEGGRGGLGGRHYQVGGGESQIFPCRDYYGKSKY